jgi:hypothetical protein
MRRLLFLFVLLTAAHCLAAGSFTITGNADVMKMGQIRSSFSTYNYGASTTEKIGRSGEPADTYYVAYDFTTTIDSIRKVISDSGLIVIDSGIVSFTMSSAASIAAGGDFVSYPIKRATWVEGTQTGAAGNCCWDSAATGVAWGTKGCANTTSDRGATKESVASGRGDTHVDNAQTGTITTGISGASLSDTNNVHGYLFTLLTNTTGYITIYTDDGTTKPTVTVYYTPRRSFTIYQGLPADIACTYIDTGATTAPNKNHGVGSSVIVGKSSGYERRILLNFLRMLDTIRIFTSSGTGTWHLDTGRVVANVSTFGAVSSNDTLKAGMIRLKSGKSFVEGLGNLAGQVKTGATWDSCTQRGDTTGMGVQTYIDWDTTGGNRQGARGANDTTGGIMDSSILLVAASTAADADISWGIPSAALADSAGGYNWLIFPVWYATADAGNTTQLILFDSDDVTADPTERPSVTVYLSYTPPAGILNARGSNSKSGIRGSQSGGSHK